MVNRRRRSRKGDDVDESVGLSGWLYTDLMLGLAVVFLGAAVIKLPDVIRNDVGEVVVGTTTSTTTTTTLPPLICNKLVVPPGERDKTILVAVPKNLRGSELAQRFKEGLRELYTFLSSAPGVLESGAKPLDVDTTQIGLILAISGADKTANEARVVREELYRELQGIIPEGTPGRDTYSTKYDSGDVVMEVFPISEFPCN